MRARASWQPTATRVETQADISAYVSTQADLGAGASTAQAAAGRVLLDVAREAEQASERRALSDL